MSNERPSYYERNKERLKAYRRAYYAQNREAELPKMRAYSKENQKALKLKERARFYGLTLDELLALLARPVCDICKQAFKSSKHQHIDHCHATQNVRGVLCVNCNHGIGNMKDDPARLRAAADYLEKK